MTLKGKRILLGLTGGIAAYKAAELTRLLVKAGCDVRVAMTEAATRFITPRFIGPILLPLVGVFWLTVLRVALLIFLFAVGLAPQMSSAPTP